MLVVQTADFFAPYGGNFIASLRALSPLLAARGWRQALVLPEAAREKDWCRKLEEDGEEVHFLRERDTVPAWARCLCKVACNEDRVLIHTHFSRYDVTAWVAHAMLGLQGTENALVWHAHSDLGDDTSLKRRFKDLLKYGMMGMSVIGIAVSEHVREQLVHAGFSPEYVRTVANGIDVSRVTVRSRSREDVLRAAGIAENGPLLLLFGWDPSRKGVDTALAAAEALSAEGIPLTLGLVGTEPLRNFVLQRANGVLPKWVRVLPPIEQVGDYFGAAALFISASRQEGLPYSVCEAMACGLPVVLSDIPTQAFARLTKGAVFFPVGDMAGLCACLRTVLGWTVEERVKAGADNSRLIAVGHDAASWAKQVVKIYDEVMA